MRFYRCQELAMHVPVGIEWDVVDLVQNKMYKSPLRCKSWIVQYVFLSSLSMLGKEYGQAYYDMIRDHHSRYPRLD